MRTPARIARGLQHELVLGNLESRRDWGRAQDYVAAMWLMLQHETPDDYVVATGETHSVGEFVEAAFAVVNLEPEKYVKHNPAFDRLADPACLVGSSEKSGAFSAGNPREVSRSWCARWWKPNWLRSMQKDGRALDHSGIQNAACHLDGGFYFPAVKKSKRFRVRRKQIS